METDRAVVGRILHQFSMERQHLRLGCTWLELIFECCTDVPASQLQRVFETIYHEEPELRGALEIMYGEHAVTAKVKSGNNNHNHNDHDLGSHDDTMEEENDNPDLDGDAVEEILRRLPLPSLMRAKSVCKEWNRVISAPNFKVRNEDHIVTQQSFRGIAFFSASLTHWFPLRLPRAIEKKKLSLCAAADGLFLFLDTHIESYSYRPDVRPLVLNLLTKQQRCLASPKRELHIACVELLVRADHFEIIAIYSTEVILLYDSRRDEWTGIPSIASISVPYRGCTHWWRSTLSVENGMAYFTNNFGRRLGCYDIARREIHYKEVAGGMPPQIDNRDPVKNFHACLPSLLACDGKLLLVGRLLKDAKVWGRFPFIEHTLVGIWELEDSTDTWSLISTTPPHLLEDTVKSSHGTDFMVAASSNKIWFTIKGSVNMLTFNLMSMEWSVLPGYTVGDAELVGCVPRTTVCAPFRITPSPCLT